MTDKIIGDCWGFIVGVLCLGIGWNIGYARGYDAALKWAAKQDNLPTNKDP